MVADWYKIKQGDYLPSIARQCGFSNYRTIWDDPHNAELNKQRQNPNVLFPGDLLYIPDRGQRVESRNTDARHKFVLHRLTVKLRLVLEDLFEKPIANADCDLFLGDEILHVTTDDKGHIEQQISPDTHGALLVIKDSQTPYEGVEIPVKIGHLDPVEEASGQVARLNNLGYFAGEVSGGDTNQFLSAIEEFQCDNNLTVDGKCGPVTQAKLKLVHGC
jgi:hypothetical protein